MWSKGVDFSQVGEGKAGLKHFADVSCIQRWAIKWALVCVNSRHAARRGQEAGFTQPRAHHLIVQLFTLVGPIGANKCDMEGSEQGRGSLSSIYGHPHPLCDARETEIRRGRGQTGEI